MKLKILFLSITLMYLKNGYAQPTYWNIDDGTKDKLDRYETLLGSLEHNLFLNAQPISEKSTYEFLSNIRSEVDLKGFSNIDRFNMLQIMHQSGRYQLPNHDGAQKSRKSVGPFYTTTTDFIFVNGNNFNLSINPQFSIQSRQTVQSENRTDFDGAAGLTLKGSAWDRIGFQLSYSYNYDAPPAYFNEYVHNRQSAPYANRIDFINDRAYQYHFLKGSVDIALIKDYIHLTVGHDDHFIGDGIRSLYLDRYAGPVTYARLNTKIWKLNYQNLYMKVRPQSIMENGLREGSDKFVVLHQLNANVTPWLNIGVFESVTFVRDNKFEIGYLNPIIFYRAIERSMGSPDKVALGINAKALFLKSFQMYGQFLLNEFTAKEFFGNKGYMHNKWGGQLGIKYFNAFTLKNLDIQGEMNLVRPYTYQHYTLANYSHNNLPLAHPLGAGIREWIVNIQYQPIRKLNIQAHYNYYQQGEDELLGTNEGNDVLKSYRNNVNRYGIKMVNGPINTVHAASLNIAYELKPALFIELGVQTRRLQSELLDNQTFQDTHIYLGARLNMARRNHLLF